MEKLLKSRSQIDFPAAWYHPVVPAYGTFPWPFRHAQQEQSDPGNDAARQGIDLALSAGYRHLDTAFTYANQELIGPAVGRAELLRAEVYVTSKLHPRDNHYDRAKSRIREAVDSIWGVEENSVGGYLDCFLIHYPGFGRPLDAWRAMQEARATGLLRHIGVSNFEIHHLERLKEKSGEYPEVNQIEFHPWIYEQERGLVRFCRDNGIALEGYSPLAQARGLQSGLLVELAKRHGTTPARIVLKWCMQHGVKPIVGSRSPEHIRANAEPYSFVLSDEEMVMINGLGRDKPVRVALQWNWNPPDASFGDRLLSRNPMRGLLRRVRRLLARYIRR